MRESGRANNGLKINISEQEAMISGRPVVLTRYEWLALERLAQAEGGVVSRSDLHAAIFHEDWDGLSRDVDVLVSRIRRKLGDSPKRQRIIETVRFEGYRLFCEDIVENESTGSGNGG